MCCVVLSCWGVLCEVVLCCSAVLWCVMFPCYNDDVSALYAGSRIASGCWDLEARSFVTVADSAKQLEGPRGAVETEPPGGRRWLPQGQRLESALPQARVLGLARSPGCFGFLTCTVEVGRWVAGLGEVSSGRRVRCKRGLTPALGGPTCHGGDFRHREDLGGERGAVTLGESHEEDPHPRVAQKVHPRAKEGQGCERQWPRTQRLVFPKLP